MKKEIFIGQVGIGGRHPVSIQSMTNTPTSNSEHTLAQIRDLKKAGCQIVRVALPDSESLPAFKRIIKSAELPVIADIHFHARLALEAIEAGSKGIRINPGNIKNPEKIREIVRMARQARIPIRIGVNWGSIDSRMVKKEESRARNMVANALYYIKLFEDEDFTLIKISLKASTIRDTLEAYQLMNRESDYPLHLGITEAGTFFPGTVKSAIGIGYLLLKGIGNTIRVSLTAPPVEEIRVAREILKAVGLRSGIELVSCPTCGRTAQGFITQVTRLEQELEKIQDQHTLRIAVMGCEVNGPGEAREADLGVAFSRDRAYIFRRGRIIDKGSRIEALNLLRKHLAAAGIKLPQ
jgi:(E)-4-hydroxy-3-methylbut-2-enyl-diphosphate synthase